MSLAYDDFDLIAHGIYAANYCQGSKSAAFKIVK